MTIQSTTWQKYEGHPGENYERYLVPAIGLPCARPVIDAAAPGPGERVLDVACGTGVAARLAAERVAPSGTVTGVDPGRPVLEIARRTAPGLEWHEGTVEHLPLADGSFDVALCSLGFQFFADRARALQEIRRVLAPGGRCALGTPGPTPPLFTAIDEVLTAHIGTEASRFVQAVFSVHDPGELRGLATTAGFGAVDARTARLSLRLPPPADFFWQYVYSTPLIALAGRLDAGARAALERDVTQRCRPFLDGEALVMELPLLVTTARRD